MAKIKTASVHIRIKEDTKKQAEAIFGGIGNFENSGDRNVFIDKLSSITEFPLM